MKIALAAEAVYTATCVLLICACVLTVRYVQCKRRLARLLRTVQEPGQAGPRKDASVNALLDYKVCIFSTRSVTLCISLYSTHYSYYIIYTEANEVSTMVWT